MKMRGNHNGERYSMITIIGKTHKKGRIMYIGECECGNIKSYYLENLRSGRTTNCGCDHYKQVSKALRKVPADGERLYSIYTNMKTRCYNINNETYARYGKRGIKMCDEWLTDFMNFYNWSILNGYKENLTIDRIDNNKGYEPNNCRWVNNYIQCYNRTNSWIVEIDGVKKPAKEWCDINGVNYKTAANRKYKGWKDIDCVTNKRAFENWDVK